MKMNFKLKDIVMAYHNYEPGAKDVFWLGITIVVGGQYFSWNAGLIAGVGTFAVATIVMGLAYISLILCTSEMISGLPFSGGAYGLARCVLGYYPGFLIGMSEFLSYTLYVSSSVLSLGSMLVNLFDVTPDWAPFFWFLFYVSSVRVNSLGGAHFWHFSTVLGVVSLVILVIYCLGSLPFVNFSQNAGIQAQDVAGAVELIGIPSADAAAVVGDNGAFFVGGMAGFMRVLPLTAWFYVGLESLAFTCTIVKEPKKSLPRGSISCILVLFATAIFTLFVCVSQSPGSFVLAGELNPLNYGYSSMFKMDFQTATGFSIPATYATAFGFQATAGKLMAAMADSKLLPTPFRIVMPGSKMPFVAYTTGATLGFFICYLCYFIPYLGPQLFNICILNGFIGYCSQCIGYVFFQTKFQSIEREFRSPLHLFGAAYAFVVFLLGILGVVAFQPDRFALYAVLVLQGFFSVYYFLVAKKKQTFSEDEQKIMLRVHVVTYNTKKNGIRFRRTASWRSSFNDSVSERFAAFLNSLSGKGNNEAVSNSSRIAASTDEDTTGRYRKQQDSQVEEEGEDAIKPTATATDEENSEASANRPAPLTRRLSKTGMNPPTLSTISETAVASSDNASGAPV